MNKNILKLFYAIAFLFVSFYLEAQTYDLLPEASRELITKIEHEKFTLTLEKFEEDGVPDLSMSKGYEFIRIGNDLETILNTLWPKRIFNICQQIQENKYHFMLQHLDQKRTEEFMETVLEEFLADSGFDINQKHEVQFQYCVEVESHEMLYGYVFKPENGVIRSTTYKGEELTLSGFTLEEIMAEISNRSGSIFSIDNHYFPDQTFEMSINIKNLNTIDHSLSGYGLSSSGCEKKVEVIYLEQSVIWQ